VSSDVLEIAFYVFVACVSVACSLSMVLFTICVSMCGAAHVNGCTVYVDESCTRLTLKTCVCAVYMYMYAQYIAKVSHASCVSVACSLLQVCV
jgi:hypothetical protein